MPIYAAFFMIFTLANVGLPGTSGFVGEFLTLLAAFETESWLAIVGTTGVILSAAYALWLYRRMIFGELVKPSLQSIADLTAREKLILAPLVVLTIGLGIYPKPVFDITSASVANLVEFHREGVQRAALEAVQDAAQIAEIAP
jgi:NADH-quinone oxidoreductase subunit M